MAKDMNESPVETGFNRTDVEQIVASMFDENKTPSVATKVEGHGRVLEITFTNRNADGSFKSEKRVLATNEATDYATKIANEIVSRARGSFSFDPVVKKPTARTAMFA